MKLKDFARKYGVLLLVVSCVGLLMYDAPLKEQRKYKEIVSSIDYKQASVDLQTDLGRYQKCSDLIVPEAKASESKRCLIDSSSQVKTMFGAYALAHAFMSWERIYGSDKEVQDSAIKVLDLGREYLIKEKPLFDAEYNLAKAQSNSVIYRTFNHVGVSNMFDFWVNKFYQAEFRLMLPERADALSAWHLSALK